MPKQNFSLKIFPHQQDFFPIKSVTKSSTARFSHKNLVEKIKIFVQDFVPIRTALSGRKFHQTISWKKIQGNSEETAPTSLYFTGLVRPSREPSTDYKTERELECQPTSNDNI